MTDMLLSWKNLWVRNQAVITRDEEKWASEQTIVNYGKSVKDHEYLVVGLTGEFLTFEIVNILCCIYI